MPPEETPAADITISTVEPPAEPPAVAPGPADLVAGADPVTAAQDAAEDAAEAAPAGATAPPPPPPPPVPDAPLPTTPAAPVVAAPAASKVIPSDWPHAGYAGVQPWEAENPPALTQNHLMLSPGSNGEEVVELAALLAYLGYGTSISAGQNPHAIYDTGVVSAVQAFCRDYGVAEDPQVRNARTQDTVGPWLWEALTRAAHKKLAAEGE